MDACTRQNAASQLIYGRRAMHLNRRYHYMQDNREKRRNAVSELRRPDVGRVRDG